MKGSIRERSPGRWAIIIDDPNSGTRKRRWHSFKGTKRQAQVECARLISEMQNGSYLAPSAFGTETFSSLNDLRQGLRRCEAIMTPLSASDVFQAPGLDSYNIAF